MQLSQNSNRRAYGLARFWPGANVFDLAGQRDLTLVAEFCAKPG